MGSAGKSPDRRVAGSPCGGPSPPAGGGALLGGSRARRVGYPSRFATLPLTRLPRTTPAGGAASEPSRIPPGARGPCLHYVTPNPCHEAPVRRRPARGGKVPRGKVPDTSCSLNACNRGRWFRDNLRQLRQIGERLGPRRAVHGRGGHAEESCHGCPGVPEAPDGQLTDKPVRRAARSSATAIPVCAATRCASSASAVPYYRQENETAGIVTHNFARLPKGNGRCRLPLQRDAVQTSPRQFNCRNGGATHSVW